MSNDFLINTRNETALVYNDVSVNENMHLATAFKILRRPGNDLMEHLTQEQYRFFRRTVIQIVLATDMAGHSELLQASRLLPAFLHTLFWPFQSCKQAACTHTSCVTMYSTWVSVATLTLFSYILAAAV